MLIPVYKDLEGTKYLGCRSFQREAIEQIWFSDISGAQVVDRYNSAWIHVSVEIGGGDERFIAKMSSKTFFDMVLLNWIQEGGMFHPCAPVTMAYTGLEYEIILK